MAQRPAVIAAVQRTRTTGVLGPVSFDEFGDLAEPRLTVLEVRDGKFSAVATRNYP